MTGLVLHLIISVCCLDVGECGRLCRIWLGLESRLESISFARLTNVPKPRLTLISYEQRIALRKVPAPYQVTELNQQFLSCPC